MQNRLLRKRFFPDAEIAWKNKGATLELTEIDKGHMEVVPFFGHRAEPLGLPSAEDYLLANDKIIGERIHYDTLTSNGIDRAVRLYLPTNRRFDFTIHMETPFMTSEVGHNDFIARELMERIGVPVILIGPEFSTNQGRLVHELGRAAYFTAGELNGMSLAESAEAGMKIAALLCEEYDLPTLLVKVGESRAAMLAHAQGPYAKKAGLEIGYFDLTDPVAPEKVVKRLRDIAKVAMWPVTEIAACGPVAFDMLRTGAIRHQLGTLSGNPNEILALLGSAMYLLGDEASKTSRFVPDSAGFHEAYFKSNKISDPKKWQDHYQYHPLYGSVILRGGHFNLGFSSVLNHVSDRIICYGNQLEENGKNDIDWQQVHEPGKHNKADLSIVA